MCVTVGTNGVVAPSSRVTVGTDGVVNPSLWVTEGADGVVTPSLWVAVGAGDGEYELGTGEGEFMILWVRVRAVRRAEQSNFSASGSDIIFWV